MNLDVAFDCCPLHTKKTSRSNSHNTTGGSNYPKHIGPCTTTPNPPPHLTPSLTLRPELTPFSRRSNASVARRVLKPVAGRGDPARVESSGARVPLPRWDRPEGGPAHLHLGPSKYRSPLTTHTRVQKREACAV